MKLYTTKEAGQFLKMSQRTIYKLMAEGKLKYHQHNTGSPVRIEHKHLLEYLGVKDD